MAQSSAPDSSRASSTIGVPGSANSMQYGRSESYSDKADLYTPEQRARRDSTHWTTVQGVLAPLQFLVFLISAWLIARYLVSGQGYALATLSIVVKTGVLYTIMVTGAIWERVVFGQYLFAKPFFWEDVVSFLVLALHTAYLIALTSNWLDPQALIALAVAAYVSYVINAWQFVRKFRMARKGRSGIDQSFSAGSAL